MKYVYIVTLFLSLAVGLSACKDGQQNISPTNEMMDQSMGAPRAEVVKPAVVGSQKTEQYADKPASVEHGTTQDPYTGTSDHANYVGKDESIAPKQVPAEKMGH